MNSRAANAESSASSCENFTFLGKQDWQMCRYHRFEIVPSTEEKTVGQPACPSQREEFS